MLPFCLSKADNFMSCLDNTAFMCIKKLEACVHSVTASTSENKKLPYEILAVIFSILSLIIAAMQNSSQLLLVIDLIAALLATIVVYV